MKGMIPLLNNERKIWDRMIRREEWEGIKKIVMTKREKEKIMPTNGRSNKELMGDNSD